MPICPQPDPPLCTRICHPLHAFTRVRLDSAGTSCPLCSQQYQPTCRVFSRTPLTIFFSGCTVTHPLPLPRRTQPKSKRNRVVALTRTDKQGHKAKLELVEEVTLALVPSDGLLSSASRPATSPCHTPHCHRGASPTPLHPRSSRFPPTCYRLSRFHRAGVVKLGGHLSAV